MDILEGEWMLLAVPSHKSANQISNVFNLMFGAVTCADDHGCWALVDEWEIVT